MYDKISAGFEDEDAPLGPSELGPPCRAADRRSLLLAVWGYDPEFMMPAALGVAPGAETSYDPEASARDAKLVLGNGEPRVWIMHLPHAGLA
jgi:hypothetical protein